MADEALDEADLDAVLDNDNNDDDYQPDQEVKWIYHEKYIPFTFNYKIVQIKDRFIRAAWYARHCKIPIESKRSTRRYWLSLF